MTDVSVIIVNWNTRQLLADCLDSLIKTADRLSLEYIVVDNGSTDGSQVMLAERYPQARLMTNQENVGFGRANNQGMDVAQGRYALLFNSDALATPGFLQRMVAKATIIGMPVSASTPVKLPENTRVFSPQAAWDTTGNFFKIFILVPGLVCT